MRQTQVPYSRDTEVDVSAVSGTQRSAPSLAAAWPTIAEPRVIGRYALFDEIASGGMGVVHFGRLLGSAGFERVVAIKRGHPCLTSDSELVKMFHEEVRLFSRIRHPNVVAALDVVEDAGELLLVMEYVHGVSLSQLARRAREDERPLPVAVAVTIACHVLRGLHAAHSARSPAGEPLGIVHRDVSPQNVLVGCDGLARILDFGVAKAKDSQLHTRVGHVKGKLGYVPPEQIRGGAADRRSDVYGAAVVLWEQLANARLFGTGGAVDTIQNVLAAKVPPLSVVAPRPVPPAVEAVVLRGLAADPGRRYESARDMAHALEEALPPLSEEELGEWVTSAAKELLAERSRRFAWAENCPVSAPRLVQPEPELSPAPEEAPTIVRPMAVEVPVPPRARRGRHFRPVALGLALASVLAGVALAHTTQRAPSAAPVASQPPSPPRAPRVEASATVEPMPIIAASDLPLEEPRPAAPVQKRQLGVPKAKGRANGVDVGF